MKQPLDLSSFTGIVTVVPYGVRTKLKHTCFNYDTGKSKVFYNINDAKRFCNRYWKGCDWDIHEGIGKDTKKVAQSC